jgi:hypothetical protein
VRAWRERRTLDQARGIFSRDIEALDRELRAKRQTLQTALRQGWAALMRLNQEIIAARPRLMPLLEKAWDNLKVADAQRKAL